MDVRVLDSLPGSGKTTYMFENMKNNPSEKYVYCSPYLAEVGDGKKHGRIQKELPELNFRSPSITPNKSTSLQRLLKEGANVAISHTLLTALPASAAGVIQEQGYTLILDETIQPIEPYQDLSSNDVSILIDAKRIAINEAEELVWQQQYGDYSGRDLEIKKLCETGSMVYHNGGLIKVLDDSVLRAFRKVRILTFMFEGSIMASWLKLKNIEYTQETVVMKAGRYTKDMLDENIEFLDPSKTIKNLHTHNGRFNNGTFSVTWYERNEDKLQTIRRSLSSVAKKLPRSDKIFWTTFKKYEDALQGARYTKPERVSKQILISPFVPKNMRASNDYKDYNTCFYCCNIYPHTLLANYLSSRGVSINSDIFALSELIQFICRGSVRVNKKMKLLILSTRMRKLLANYLQGG